MGLDKGACQRYQLPPALRGESQLTERIIRPSAPPQCGGVVFWHVPKTGGSTMECVLSMQPEWSCCYRGQCGLCHSTCHHRWKIEEPFSLPGGLLANETRMARVRFVTSFHQGPTSPTPGMTADVGSLWHFALLRERAALHGCKIVLTTLLRHPASQLVSAFRYTRGMSTRNRSQTTPLPFSRWLDELGTAPDTMLGIPFRPLRATVPMLRDPEMLRRMHRANIQMMESTLLSQLDIVGHTERFETTLLLIMDAAGLQHPLVCPTIAEQHQNDSVAHPMRYIAALARVSELAEWYEGRLQRFDAATAQLPDGTFAARLRWLQQGRTSVFNSSHCREQRARGNKGKKYLAFSGC